MIKCKFYDYEKKQFSQVEIDNNLKIFPCCFFLIENTLNNNFLFEIENDLKKISIKDFMDQLHQRFNVKFWSDGGHSLCRKNCSCGVLTQ